MPSNAEAGQSTAWLIRVACARLLGHAGGMSRELPRACQELAESQAGVLSRRQALARGMPPDVIDWRLRSGRLQQLHRGVYAVFTGQPPRAAMLWAAVLRAGSGAVLSHQTAAELFGLGVGDRSNPLIHVTVAESRRVAAIAGVVIHRSSRLAEVTHPTLQPPRIRLEDTVLDLVNQSVAFDAAFSLLCSACQRGLTKPELIAKAMTNRARLRWRSQLVTALAEVGAGVHSLLESRYLHEVERPHGLPTAVRQARIVHGERKRYLDNLYKDQRLCVELDGHEAHPDERRWQDLHRINAINEQGITTLRYTWSDVDRRSCDVASQVAATLRRLGWRGTPRPCSPRCPVGRPQPQRRT